MYVCIKLGVRIHSQCLAHTSITFELTLTVSRRGACFWDSRPCVTKCEKDGKAYVERVQGSERGMVVSQDGHALSLLW